jgi:antitoxin YefM
MRVLPLSEAKAKLSELVDVVERRDEPVTITRNGKAVAVLVSKDECEAWHETNQVMSDREFVREIRKGIRTLAKTKTRYTVESLFGE